MCAICNFKIDFGVSHPASLQVAVATRRAMDQGTLAQQQMEGALATARLKLASIDALALLQARIEATLERDALRGLPDFYVLLIEVDTWGFFHATENGFDPDVVPELPDLTSADPLARSIVIVTSEVALRALIEGTLDASTVFDEGLAALDSPLLHEATMRSIVQRLSSQAELQPPI